MKYNITKKILNAYYEVLKSHPEKSLNEICDIVAETCNIEIETVYETLDNPLGEK